MTMNKKTLESGKEYTLSDLFSGKNKIIIPDLQRDYCWGDKAWDKNVEKHTELVSGFVDNLLEMFKNRPKDNLTLGLIYGYESPKNHIQLCDGQQRITTLFLLLGMLNRLSENKFIKLLISEKELLHDDKEPYLQYSIRESTLYFLSDLVCEFFLKKEVKLKDINSSNWYFSEYDQDASIQSMLAAIHTIEKILSQEIDYEGFGNFIANNLQMLYYDMGDRTRGEETFVVINTTGEPLSATENLKPILIGNIENNEDRKKFSKEWEDREEWFWKNRNGSINKGNNIADHGVREFFRWITILMFDFNDNKESFSKNLNLVRESVTVFIKPKAKETELYNYLSELHKYFDIVKFIFENEDNNIFSEHKDWLAPNDKDKYINTQITWFKLLPIIEYLHRFGLDVENRKIIRVKTFFENLSRIDNISKNIGELIYDAIRIIKKLPNDDIASVLQMERISSQLLSKEEQMKFQIYLDSNIRSDIEDRFWEAEKHPVWKGEILPLLEWSFLENKFDLSSFDHNHNMFKVLFYDKMDLTRRALLTLDLKKFPRQFYGKNYSFCWEYSDWQILINDNKEKFGKLLKELKPDNYQDQFKEMINKNPKEKDFDEFVKIPELLKFCKQKNMQWGGEKGWVLIKKKMRSGEHANLKAYRLYLDLKKDENCAWNSEQWKLWFYYKGGSCVVFENKSKNVVIDIRYLGSDKYQVQLFRRKIDAKNYKQQLSDIGQNLDLKWGEMNRYISGDLEENDIPVFLKKISNSNYNNL